MTTLAQIESELGWARKIISDGSEKSDSTAKANPQANPLYCKCSVASSYIL
jgi:hypothetical protein